jgi:hypothetical protein
MAIQQSLLRGASTRRASFPATSLEQARAAGLRTAFLCHSHRDAELVKGFVTILNETGWRVYVDWQDTTMPDRPNRETAARLKQRIEGTTFFLFLATANSMTSRWCPWEIGYADGKKHIDSILVCATTDGVVTHGSEYLDLYRRIDVSDSGHLAVWNPGDYKNGIFVSNL